MNVLCEKKETDLNVSSTLEANNIALAAASSSNTSVPSSTSSPSPMKRSAPEYEPTDADDDVDTLKRSKRTLSSSSTHSTLSNPDGNQVEEITNGEDEISKNELESVTSDPTSNYDPSPLPSSSQIDDDEDSSEMLYRLASMKSISSNQRIIIIKCIAVIVCLILGMDIDDETSQSADDNSFRGVPIENLTNILQNAPRLSNMEHIMDTNHTFMMKPYKYNVNNPTEPKPNNVRYIDKWDFDHIKMPCSETIEHCTGRDWQILCLEQLLNEVCKIYTPEDRAHFLSDVLLNIITLALKVNEICGQVKIYTKKRLLVNMFYSVAATLIENCIFFGSRHGSSPWKLEKLKSILHYFTRITQKMPIGVLSFRRYCLPKSCTPEWGNSSNTLCKIHLTKNKTIEDMHGFLQVDFANKYIGGGVMNHGCVQEEIRFVICPEMLLSLLLCEVMEPQECIFLTGCERFSSYKGYSTTYKWLDNYDDPTPRDEWGRRLCHVVAIDAICFNNPAMQWNGKYVRRELLKAYSAFRVPAGEKKLLEGNVAGIATGNWGCGAFRGDKQLKAIIQLMAASEAERPLIYITYHDRVLVDTFSKLYDYLIQKDARVKDLYKYLAEYSQIETNLDIFDYILTTPMASEKLVTTNKNTTNNTTSDETNIESSTITTKQNDDKDS
ncbi:unnamed protein product [Didymodactylos carnosus]|uniref:poly(ADP-ribose) glycohydrolase n=1 Tax=Didymodactylos carnosus TaxID=1234261 RepID=A0A8S2DFF6_9BILA|nr:unnamed protein product [Didymodactylos carnosus]CAF3666522.1 unnamed protein product [Didymodactylos carnosus]